MPIPQKRARVTRGGMHTYDPNAKDKALIMKELLSRKLEIQEPPIAFYMAAFMKIPKSYSGKRRDEINGKHHTKKPDIDNIYKFYSDLLQEICYNSDSEICHVYLEKRYSKVPRVEIEISTVD